MKGCFQTCCCSVDICNTPVVQQLKFEGRGGKGEGCPVQYVMKLPKMSWARQMSQ